MNAMVNLGIDTNCEEALYQVSRYAEKRREREGQYALVLVVVKSTCCDVNNNCSNPHLITKVGSWYSTVMIIVIVHVHIPHVHDVHVFAFCVRLWLIFPSVLSCII